MALGASIEGKRRPSLGTTSFQRKEQIQREIDATDRQIDQLVYALYGLTADEIAIVEAATA